MSQTAPQFKYTESQNKSGFEMSDHSANGSSLAGCDGCGLIHPCSVPLACRSTKSQQHLATLTATTVA